jgi:hypothetical protein
LTRVAVGRGRQVAWTWWTHPGTSQDTNTSGHMRRKSPSPPGPLEPGPLEPGTLEEGPLEPGPLEPGTLEEGPLEPSQCEERNKQKHKTNY